MGGETPGNAVCRAPWAPGIREAQQFLNVAVRSSLSTDQKSSLAEQCHSMTYPLFASGPVPDVPLTDPRGAGAGSRA